MGGILHCSKICILLLSLISATYSQKSDTKHGRDVAINVARSLCWYEFLQKTTTNVNQFLRCDNQVQKIKNAYASAPDMVFGGALSNVLPEWFLQYMEECDPYLRSPKSSFKARPGKANYAYVIGDRFPQSYSFQAFAQCLVAEVDTRYGSTAMLALESRLKGERYWRETMYRRENDFRARHNVSGFELDTLLTEDAQHFADELARTCSFKPSNPMSRDRLYDRQFTGENIAMNGGVFLRDEDSANVAVTGWYEQISNYNFATGASRNSLPVDQFTQSVWKATGRVGYGMGINKKCPNGYTHYIVARYFPAGNIPNSYLENVQPPISSTAN